MIILPDLKNRKTAVFGLGATGLATAKALSASGAQVFTWDEYPAARERAANTAYSCEHPKNWPWAELQFLALSPGVPLTHPKPHAIVRKARSAKVRILGDLELFAMALSARTKAERPNIVAITGSNGKSTTTALIGHILKDTGREVGVGGNIGEPLLAMAPFHKDRVYVLELSSYQLDLASSFHADIAILLNLSPDHLDRHGDMAGYAAAKQRIFFNQTKDDVAIIGVDDEYAQGICATLSGKQEARVYPISVKGALGHGVYSLGGNLYYNLSGKSGEAGAVDQIPTLRGAHNRQNAAAALAACSILGVAPSVSIKAMERFKGLPHRSETIARLDGVSFVNDSKATNVDAAARALTAFDNIFWIAGGRAKQDGAAPLKTLMSRVQRTYLIGDAAEDFERALGAAVASVQCGNLAVAVAAATRDALEFRRRTGEEAVVLLSPACASQDQFKNFEDRGETFRRLVMDEAEAIRAQGDDAAPSTGGAAA